MNTTYQSGDGTVTEFKIAARAKAVSWSGIDTNNQIISSTNLSGVVTVLNFWYASCPPCRVETPDLVALADEFNGQAQFVGVNVRDSADTAKSFNRNFKVTYPTLIDANSGDVVLAFTGVVTPSAVPTTLVIDRQGRVAARILGLAEKATLRALIKSVIAEAMPD
ncbi:MAG: TlpA family protein disulfide reductase [Rhodoluna sp.]|nr:TlpA family protein disulfide reductase [Rhodoluna sp.]